MEIYLDEWLSKNKYLYDWLVNDNIYFEYSGTLLKRPDICLLMLLKQKYNFKQRHFDNFIKNIIYGGNNCCLLKHLKGDKKRQLCILLDVFFSYFIPNDEQINLLCSIYDENTIVCHSLWLNVLKKYKKNNDVVNKIEKEINSIIESITTNKENNILIVNFYSTIDDKPQESLNILVNNTKIVTNVFIKNYLRTNTNYLDLQYNSAKPNKKYYKDIFSALLKNLDIMEEDTFYEILNYIKCKWIWDEVIIFSKTKKIICDKNKLFLKILFDESYKLKISNHSLNYALDILNLLFDINIAIPNKLLHNLIKMFDHITPLSIINYILKIKNNNTPDAMTIELLCNKHFNCRCLHKLYSGNIILTTRCFNELIRHNKMDVAIKLVNDKILPDKFSILNYLEIISHNPKMLCIDDNMKKIGLFIIENLVCDLEYISYFVIEREIFEKYYDIVYDENLYFLLLVSKKNYYLKQNIHKFPEDVQILHNININLFSPRGIIYAIINDIPINKYCCYILSLYNDDIKEYLFEYNLIPVYKNNALYSFSNLNYTHKKMLETIDIDLYDFLK